jgi:tRNA pseudouridine38-40 synthase
LATSTKIVLIMEYDGTNYHGSQLQASLPTIQGETEMALQKLTGERSRVMSASRTDAGVHAKGQVASFITSSPLPLATFVGGLNYYLPNDIAVKAAYRVDDSFDVRRDATSREYDYYILNSLTRSPTRQAFTHLVTGHLDTKSINRACQALIGEHDFASFTTCDGLKMKNTVRTVYRAEVTEDDDLLVFGMVANSFLPHQVRNTVGALIRVGLDLMNVDEFYNIAEAKTPGLAGPTAPACGLCLMQINYPHPFGERNDENL